MCTAGPGPFLPLCLFLILKAITEKISTNNDGSRSGTLLETGPDSGQTIEWPGFGSRPSFWSRSAGKVALANNIFYCWFPVCSKEQYKYSKKSRKSSSYFCCNKPPLFPSNVISVHCSIILRFYSGVEEEEREVASPTVPKPGRPTTGSPSPLIGQESSNPSNQSRCRFQAHTLADLSQAISFAFIGGAIHPILAVVSILMCTGCQTRKIHYRYLIFSNVDRAIYPTHIFSSNGL